MDLFKKLKLTFWVLVVLYPALMFLISSSDLFADTKVYLQEQVDGSFLIKETGVAPSGNHLAVGVGKLPDTGDFTNYYVQDSNLYGDSTTYGYGYGYSSPSPTPS